MDEILGGPAIQTDRIDVQDKTPLKILNIVKISCFIS